MVARLFSMMGALRDGFCLERKPATLYLRLSHLFSWSMRLTLLKKGSVFMVRNGKCETSVVLNKHTWIGNRKSVVW